MAEADSLKSLRERAIAQCSDGGEPVKEPIRRRGYYRALKRNEGWALRRKLTFDLINHYTSQMIERWKTWDKLFMGASGFVKIEYGEPKKPEKE